MSLKCNIQFSRWSSHEENESRLTKKKKNNNFEIYRQKMPTLSFCCMYLYNIYGVTYMWGGSS